MRDNVLVGATVLALIMPAAASAGHIVIYSDDWLFVNGSHTAIADQIGDYFNRGEGGRFLDWMPQGYGPDGYYEGPTFTRYSKTVISSQPSLALMLQYDGIFVGLNGANKAGFKADLSEYVLEGGNVFIAAGYDADPAVDGAAWNDFLNPFGLGYGGLDWIHYYNNCQGQPGRHCSFNASSPLTGLPTGMVYDNGHTVLDMTPGETTYSRIIATMNTDNGIISIGASADIPEPGAAALILGGLAALSWRLRWRACARRRLS